MSVRLIPKWLLHGYEERVSENEVKGGSELTL
jgi:hypothetical protein